MESRMKAIEELDIVRLNIQLTKKCNQRCKSCNSYELDSSDEMSVDEVKKAIKEACELFPIKNIAFTGGEPTTYSGILDVAQYARQHSPKVSITTNGFYCTSQERVKQLVNAGINRYSFSYHRIGKQDLFTGVKGSEERIRKAIDWLLEEKERQSELYIKLGTLFDGKNIDEVEAVLDYAESKDIDLYIEVWDNQNYLWHKPEMTDQFEITEEYRKSVELALDRIRKWKEDGRKVLIDDAGIMFMQYWYTKTDVRGGCPLGYTDLYIESNGDVRTGCWFLNKVGNIKELSMQDIISGPSYKECREKMVKRQCSGCTCGYLMQAKYMHTKDFS